MTDEPLDEDPAEVERLQRLLSPYRWSGVVPAPPVRRPAPWPMRLAAASLLAVALGLAARAGGRPPAVPAGAESDDGWWVATLEGAPRIEGGASRLQEGGTLTTDGRSRAEVRIPGVGRVELRPGSRLRVLRADGEESRLALDEGSLRAVTTTPPRTFFVETPTATAVDLGCAFTVDVAPDGSGLLRVSAGWVGFEREGLACLVPAGAECRTLAGSGPGIPRFTDAEDGLRAALDRMETGGAVPEDLDRVLGSATVRDTLSLWHLLPRLSAAERERVLDRTLALVPLPPGATEAGILRLDAGMLAAWRDSMRRWW